MQLSPWIKEVQTLDPFGAIRPPNTGLKERLSKCTCHDLNPLPKFKYTNISTKYSKGNITKRPLKGPKSAPKWLTL